MKFVLCDDDEIFLNSFKSILTKDLIRRGLLAEILIFSNANDLYNADCKGVDAFFLDIDMPNISGIELAKLLRVNRSCEFVFVSSHEELIQFSMRVKPIAFIRKLSIEADLKNAVDNLLEELVVKRRTVYLNDGKKGVNIELRSVRYFSSDKDYVLVHTLMQEHLSLRQKLDDVELKVKNFYFLRIHSRYLVNLYFVERFEQDSKKKQKLVILKNGESLPVSVKYWQEVKERLKIWFERQTLY